MPRPRSGRCPRASRPPRLLTALVALLLACAGTAAATPSDLSPDPLDRASLLALPSIYRVDVVLHLTALRTPDGEVIDLPPEARRIAETGTAFAVAPDGWLVTAAHVAAPDAATVARLAMTRKLASEEEAHDDESVRDWVALTGAVPVGYRRGPLTIRPAGAGAAGDAGRSFAARRVVAGRGTDLALVRIAGAQGAPALRLDEATTAGTPVVAMGFGRGSSLHDAAAPRGELEPGLRRGELVRTGVLEGETPERRVLAISAPVLPGDSGGPVVDEAGEVRGVVIRRTPAGGFAERATEVRTLLEREGVAPGEGPAAASFRDAMRAFRALALDDARRGFAETRRAFPSHALADRQSDRAAALASGEFRLGAERRPQRALLAVGAVALVLALACAAALAATSHRGGGRAAGGR